MKPICCKQNNRAFTLMEAMVVIFMLAVLATMLLPPSQSHRKNAAMRAACVNNLKQVGLAFRMWDNGSTAYYPMNLSVTRGGTKELIVTGDVAQTFLVMSNELTTPKILYCPADTKRFPATNFASGFNNENISYFIGVDANGDDPQMILAGDDNFEIGDVPVKSGLLNLSSKTPITWSAARHKFAGNLCYSDGSVQLVKVLGSTNLLHQAEFVTNGIRLAIP
jgi:type II secretory pathway pseudopilin PulG